MNFKPCSLDYSKFRDGDIFFSHGCDFLGWLICVGQRGKFGPNDLSQPNHAGFLYSIQGQWFAAEVGPKGIALNSLDKYCKSNNQIVAIMRWNVFDNLTVLEKWKNEMALWIRRKQNSGYDFFGAIRSAAKNVQLLNWVLKYLPNDPNKEFCSEDICAWLKKVRSWVERPICKWLPKEPLDPLDLYDGMTRDKEAFEALLSWKIT